MESDAAVASLNHIFSGCVCMTPSHVTAAPFKVWCGLGCCSRTVTVVVMRKLPRTPPFIYLQGGLGSVARRRRPGALTAARRPATPRGGRSGLGQVVPSLSLLRSKKRATRRARPESASALTRILSLKDLRVARPGRSRLGRSRILGKVPRRRKARTWTRTRTRTRDLF